jgi:DNA-binding transcriptional LysR family regulator
MSDNGISLDRMRTFVRVAELGSLSAAARAMGIGQSTVTRHINEIQNAVGVSLLGRTTRRVTLTAEGRRFYTNCVAILRLVDQAGEEARDAREAPSGTVRLSCTAALGVMHVTRMIFEFQDLHPDIRIDLNLTDKRIDLAREGIDMALRLGPVVDEAMKLTTVGVSRRKLVAAPQYLALRGRPSKPEDLSGHNCVVMSNVAGSSQLFLTSPAQERVTVPMGGTLLVDHGLAARAALLAGRGVGPTHLWLVQDLLDLGDLEIVLDTYELDSSPISLLIVPERAGLARVRLLCDFLIREIQALPGITPHHTANGMPSF